MYYDKTFIENIIKEYSVFMVGLTGGIASGKSFTAEIFKRLGAEIIDFDIIAADTVKNGSDALREISELFGSAVIQENGELDRNALGRIVFSNIEAKKKLENILHPLIFISYIERLENIINIKPGSMVISDIPLLFELNLESLFHKTVLVYTDGEQQLSRLLKRNKIDEIYARALIASQLPIEEKLGMASMVIYNVKDKESLVAETEKAWKELLKYREMLTANRCVIPAVCG